jgi:exonuclease V gamma subunit
MAALEQTLNPKHLEYREKKDIWTKELNEFLFVIKYNSLASKHIEYNQVISSYRKFFFRTLETVKEYFNEINDQLFFR